MSLCCRSKKTAEVNVNKPRGCTDTFCLGIFCLFWAVLIFVATFAFVVGDPLRLVYGQDSFGNTCGINNEALGNLTFSGMDMTDRPYLFFLNVSNIQNTLKLCIKKCPDRLLVSKKEIRKFELETESGLCRYDIASFREKSVLYPTIGNNTIEDIFRRVEEQSGHFLCPVPPVFPMKTVFNRCVPTHIAGLASSFIRGIYAYLNSFDTIQQVVSDVYAGRYEILGMVILALVLSFIGVLTIHWLASLVSWIIMIVACVAAILGTALLWWAYVDVKFQLDMTPFNELLTESVKNERTFLVYSILSTLFTIILLLIVITLRKRVELVVTLFEEAGKCIRSMPLLLIQPIWTFIALLMFFVFWIAVLVALATAYYPVKNDVNPKIEFNATLPTPLEAPLQHQLVFSKAYQLVTYNNGSWVQYMWWYHLIALIWTSEFILGCQQMVIAGAVATWYFTRDRSTVSFPVAQSTIRLIVYHMGSVVLGAFLITLFKIPRIILTFLISKMKKHENIKIVSCCLKCCTCCLWALEKFIRYMNHNAYTVIAIQGIGFCTAAREAFDILVSNALQIAIINSVGDFILFLGKCGVTAISTFIGLLIMKNNPELHFYAIPVFIVSVFTFFIAHCVFSVYEMVIDTLFLCCCEDALQNDGSKEKPYYGGTLVRYLTGRKDEHALQPLKEQDNTDGEE